MDAETTPPRGSFALKVATVSTVVVVVIAVVVLGLSKSSPTPLRVLAARYDCVPSAEFPQLTFGGKSGEISTTYGGFTATYRASVPDSSAGVKFGAGMPFNGALTISDGTTKWALPRPKNAGDSSIETMCVIAFHRERFPSVMIQGFSGGAHCCDVPVIYAYDDTEKRYVTLVDMSPDHYMDPHAFDPNQGFTPVLAGTQVLLKTGDGRFDYAFDCFACSATPIVLDAVVGDGLTDVTLQHPARVVADARSIWKSAQTQAAQFGAGAFGLLPAWVADECALGRGATAWTTIQDLAKAGKLSDELFYEETLNRGSYVARLRSFLLRNDYCTGQI
jgi:hypothetical protein